MKALLIAALGLFCVTPATAFAQEDTPRKQLEAKLLRDQGSILRKAARLRDLMKNLQKVYKEQGRQREVDLLTEGLTYLDKMKLMDTVAGVREALDARALSKANQEAQKVIEQLQKLLQILLDRPSMDKIDEEIDKAKKMEATAAELEQRQQNLLDKNLETSKSTATRAEKQLQQEMRQLARMQRAEAEETMRNAGTRQPFLENALRRVQQLEREQKGLENSLKRKSENPDAKDRSKRQLFDINALKQQTVQQMADRSKQRNMERIARKASDLQQAIQRKDADEMQSARDALQGEMQRIERNLRKDGAAIPKAFSDLTKELEQTKNADLGKVAAKIEKQANKDVAAQKGSNNKDLNRLAEEAKRTARQFTEERKAAKQKPGPAEKTLDDAAKKLAEAARLGAKKNQTPQTLSKLSQALRKLDEAKAAVQRRNPSDQNRAGKMATQAADAARELRESPGADPEANRRAAERNARRNNAARDNKRNGNKRDDNKRDGGKRDGGKRDDGKKTDGKKTDGKTPIQKDPKQADPKHEPRPNDKNEPAENRAANRLDEVEREMRRIAENLQRDAAERKAGRQPDSQRQQQTRQRMQQNQQRLDEAKQALQQALRENNQNQQQNAQAQKRQQQLNQQAQRIRDQMQQAQQRGDLSKEQQKAADQAMQRAQKQMQQAQKARQQNRQSQAAQQQQKAAQEVDRARQAMERNRPKTDEQKQQLKEQSKEQKKLADDIMNLAKLAEQRKNQRAREALDKAAEKAEEAAEELDKGNNEEAEKKQEEARDALREAQQELEEERERYEDLRQEELLFKIQEELKQFLAKQEPITKKTEEASTAMANSGRLSRRARRRLNQLGDEESALKNKAEFLRRALEKEDVLVFSHAIKASEQDLAEVQKRLGGNRPQPDRVTLVLQKDVEDRTRKLIAALKREQKRREEQRKREQKEKKNQKNQKKNDQNRQNNNQNQRRRLVSIVAELEMLKQMEQDMLKRTEFMGKLIESRGDEVSELDLALLERLAHRHNQITEIFLALKKQVEETLNPPQHAAPKDPQDPQDPKKGSGKNGKKGK